MRIRTYDEVDHYSAYRLSSVAFGWGISERAVRVVRMKDPRYLDYFAVYAVERGKPLAQVVPMRMPVRLATGIEEVGGLQAVCSHPTVWGEGYARRLMKHIHDEFRSLGLRISTLTTSRNIRGYHVYQGLGYRDITDFYRGTRYVPRNRRRPEGIRLRKAKKRDLPDIQRLFMTYTRDLLGWTIREPEVLPTTVTTDSHYLDRYRMIIRNGEVVGYLRMRPEWNVHFEEVMAPRARDFRDAIALRECEVRGKHASTTWITARKDQDRLRNIGYDLDGPIGDTTMAVSLKPGLKTRDLPALFGADSGRFAHYPTDDF